MTRGRRWRGCAKKVRYRTDYDAQDAIAGVRRCRDAVERGADRLRVYECADCGGYHLTSQEQRS